MGVPNNHGVFLLQMIILGCEMGVPLFLETPIYTHTHIKLDPPQMGPINSSTKTPAVHNKQDHGNPQPSFL